MEVEKGSNHIDFYRYENYFEQEFNRIIFNIGGFYPICLDRNKDKKEKFNSLFVSLLMLDNDLHMTIFSGSKFWNWHLLQEQVIIYLNKNKMNLSSKNQQILEKKDYHLLSDYILIQSFCNTFYCNCIIFMINKKNPKFIIQNGNKTFSIEEITKKKKFPSSQFYQ